MQSTALKRFDPKQYYSIEYSYKYYTGPVGVKLTGNGIDLVTEFYTKKYGVKILTTNDVKEVLDFIKKLRRDVHGDLRQGFILSNDEHSIPIVYVREGRNEAIIYGDSLGLVPDDSNVKKLSQLGIRVLQIEDLRQMDLYSCHTDALVFLREFLGKNLNTGKYFIPSLINTILKLSYKHRPSGRSEQAFFIKSPPALLKLVQYEDFLQKHKAHPNIKIHHNIKRNRHLTLEKFLQKYAPELEDIKSISSYLRKKGIKLADIIEIQFYLKQLRYLGLPESLEQKFIKKSQAFLLQQPSLLSKKDKRPGLYDFAEKFLSQYCPQQPSNDTPAQIQHRT
ncbi:Uncharacterised protein [Legionella busanensis]|uniref:Uncharacterized protein n=1 Tax=Legionella busanensis TaxID=190655 RepID=A0A378JW71_9GAMM|nr:hypothetical protein [Legionella busanensis]STX52462.1 Uncharacterised protein [Legionella busanensis]